MTAGGVRVDGDRRPGARVRPGHRVQHPLDARRQPLLVHGALEHPGPYPGPGDALGDVADEELCHLVAGRPPEGLLDLGRPAPEVERHLVERVAAGRHDDVQLGHVLGDPLDPGQGSALPEHGDVDERADAGGRQGAQLGHRVHDPGVLVPPLVRVVLLYLGGEDEDVLVHQRAPEPGRRDRAEYRLHLPVLGHGRPPLSVRSSPVIRAVTKVNSSSEVAERSVASPSRVTMISVPAGTAAARALPGSSSWLRAARGCAGPGRAPGRRAPGRTSEGAVVAGRRFVEAGGMWRISRARPGLLAWSAGPAGRTGCGSRAAAQDGEPREFRCSRLPSW